MTRMGPAQLPPPLFIGYALMSSVALKVQRIVPLGFANLMNLK